MDNQFRDIVSTVEPIPDSIHGPLYRCALTLRDGTVIPCAVLQSKAKRIDLAKRRIKEEMSGKGIIGDPDPLGLLLSVFVAGGNRVNDYDVVSAAPSRFATPFALLDQIHGETVMAWTGWVFEMRDGRLFSYGSSFELMFLDLPAGYDFDDVAKVHNHSYLSADGELRPLERFERLPADYDVGTVIRERIHFECHINGI